MTDQKYLQITVPVHDTNEAMSIVQGFSASDKNFSFELVENVKYQNLLPTAKQLNMLASNK